MSTLKAILFVLSAAGLVSGQAGLATMPACGQNCVTNMLGDAALNCPASDLACLCANPDFGFGIRDCANAACGTVVGASFTVYASSICSATPTAATTPASTSATVTTTTPLTSTSIPASSTSAVATSTSQSITSVPTTLSTTSTAVSSSAPASSASSTTTSSASAGSPSTDLSLAAKIGIGVGAGAGAIALFALILCLCLRRRGGNSSGAASGRLNKEDLKISQPIPTASPVYASSARPGESYGSPARTGPGKSELEMMSHRYEDMVPRHQPRTMV